MDLKSQLPKNAREYAIGFVVGALVMVWMGFGNFGWLLPSQAATLAKKQSEVAVNNAYAGICSAQFKAAADAPTRLAALEKADRWSRGEVIAKAGFAVVPGVKETNRDVAQACADLLLPEKPAKAL